MSGAPSVTNYRTAQRELMCDALICDDAVTMKLHLVALCACNRAISRDGHDKDCFGSCASRSKRKKPWERREQVDIGAAQTTRRRGVAVGRGYGSSTS